MTPDPTLTDHADQHAKRMAGVGGDLPPDILEAGLRRDDPLADEERRRHRPDGSRCALCWQVWPCSGVRTLPTLTDEELAESDIEWLRAILWSPSSHGPTRLQAAATLDRLIAALRASREQVKAVKAVLRAKSGLIDHLQADLRASREEVAQLKRQIADEYRDYLGG